jgi:hypothetical protein
MQPFIYPAKFGNQVQPERALESDPRSRNKAGGGSASGFSDAGLLRIANRWSRWIVFGTMADPLWPIVVAFCIMPVLLSATLTVVSGTGLEALAAQCLLAAGTFTSLRLLKDYPMVNPVHVVALLFHWWFGYGPTVCALSWSWKGDSARADAYLTGGTTPTLIVAFGLPIYAWAARWVLHHWKRPELTAIAPNGPVYEMGTLGRMGVVAGLAALALQALSLFGLHAYETVNYLGGQRTVVWWLIPLEQAALLGNFALAAGCSFLATPNLKRNAIFWWVILGLVALSFQRALTAGSKGPLVFPALYFLVAFANWRRRVPWLFLVAVVFGYLAVVEPFVASVRLQAEKAHATTGDERIELFNEGWRDFHIGGQGRDVNVESLFRGIYPLAKEIADQSSFMEGPWKGQSVRDGLSAMLPRALFPDKTDSNMGNFFARQLGVSGAGDYMNNVAITMPFEIVGNYGWLAGWLSFAVLGVVWASFVAFTLTVPRMTTHPLTPYLIVFGMAIEESVGQFGNQLKMLLLSLALLYLVCQMTRKRSSVMMVGASHKVI